MTLATERVEPRSGGEGRAVLCRLAATVLLVAALPLFLVAAAVVWLSLGRPLMFRQIRCGLGAEPFTLHKFRTMHDGRDAEGRLLPDAERQTPVTRLMRLSRVDELPQLLAIARGDMAFVGPRPLMPATIKAFGEPGRLRCAVLPGLTGWAQVNGNTRLTDDEKLALDLWYVENRSLVLDWRILISTALVILRGERVNADALSSAWSAMRRSRPVGAARGSI